MQTKFDFLRQPFMKSRNSRWLLTMLSGMALLLITWPPIPAFSQSDAGFQRTPWQMHHGYGIISLLNTIPTHGDASLYNVKRVPSQDDPGWEAPPLDKNGNISFSQPSVLPRDGCFKKADFTYFQTLVEIPQGAVVSQFEVGFEKVDDGARAYVYNSTYPDGAYIPNTDIVLKGEPKTADLSSLVVAGETNRVVIVQVDDCATDNNLRNAQLYVNGTAASENAAIGPQTTPTPEIVAGCTQEDFLAAVREGEQTGTVTLKDSCRYILTSAGNDWNGGSGAFLYNATTIEGNGAIIERSPNAPSFRILGVQTQQGVTLRNLTIRNGNSTANGGGIYANTDLTLENVRLEANRAAQGGALVQYAGKLVIDNGTLFDNHATDLGGAIFKDGGTMEITDTVFGQNSADSGNGAALFVGGGVTGNARLANSTITDNDGNKGAAITAWGALDVRNTIIANHETGLAAGGTYTVTEGYNLYAKTTIDVQTLTEKLPLDRVGNSVIVPDPRFVDAAALDYALQQSSPAVDRGTDSLLGGTALATDAGKNARPYVGTTVDIGAYEFQGQGGPSLSIVKQGPFWINAATENDFSLTVANDGVASAETVEVVDLLPAGATYVDGSATAGGTFANGRVTWQVGTLDPNAKVFLQYAVKATQALVSDDYRAQSTVDPTVVATGPTITSPLNDNLVASTGFFPRPDGFSFQNYGAPSPDSDLTIDDMVKIFGEAEACKSTAPCVLSAKAENWRKTWLRRIEGGHCAGMAMGSLNIFANDTLAASDLQSSANTTFDLTKEDARRYVAFYASTQGSPPTNALQLQLQQDGYNWTPANTPTAILDALIKNLGDPNAGDRYRLGFQLHPADGGGKGHTVVPFAVEKLNDNEYLIYLYENNQPNRFDLAIKVNRTTEEWTYVGTTNPDKPLMEYRGDATSGNLWLISWRWHTALPKDPNDLVKIGRTLDSKLAYSGDFHTIAPAYQSSGMLEFDLNGEGYLLVTRSDGKRAGFDLLTGQWISEIEGAQEVPILLGLGFNNPSAVHVPYSAGMTYSVQVASRKTAFGNAQGTADLNIAGPGFGMNVRELVLDAPEPQRAGAAQSAPDLMTLNVDPDNKSLTFTPGTDDAEAPTLTMAISYLNGADYSVDVQNVPVAPGYAVGLSFDDATNAITIESNSADPVNYQVDVKRINSDGVVDQFSDSVNGSVNGGDAAGVRLNVGEEWDGQTAPAVETVVESTLPAPEAVPGPSVTAFVHVAYEGETLTSGTTLDHPLTNGNPDALLFITAHITSTGVDTTTYKTPIGIVYRADLDRWVFFSEDESSPVSAGTSFNVLVAQPGENTFVHTSTAENIKDSWTVIDHPLANDNPDALLLVTHRQNGTDDIYINAPLGVWYNNETGRWAILRQDSAPMPANAAFNVMVMASGDNASVHKTSAQNTSANQSLFQHPLANNNPDMLLFVTSNYNPSGRGGTLNNHPAGVLYDGTQNGWVIANVDQAEITVGSSFNVFMFPAFIPPAPSSQEEGTDDASGPAVAEAVQPSAQLVFTLDAHAGPVNSILYINDRLISGSEDSTVRRWDGESVSILAEATSPVKSLDTLPGEGVIAAGLADGTLQIWEIESAEPLFTLTDHESAVNAVAWSSAPLLATGGSDGTVHIWTFDGGSAEMILILEAHQGAVNALSWSAEGDYLASGGEDGLIRIWDVTTWESRLTIEGHVGAVNDLLLVGDALVSTGDDGTIRIWTVQSEESVAAALTLTGHTGAVNAIAVSEDGMLFSASDDGTIRVWNGESVDAVETLYILKGHVGPINDVIAAGNGLLSAGNDGTVRVWDLTVAASSDTNADENTTVSRLPRIQAESGTYTGSAASSDVHSGFDGTGFAAFLTSVGSAVQLDAAVASAGTYEMNIRYAAGPDGPETDRTMSLYVNDSFIGKLTFVRTGAWATWADQTTTIDLNAGDNTIKFSFDEGDTGYINIDYVESGVDSGQ